MLWIPKLGCDVDATKPAWRSPAINIRILDSEAWMRGGCNEVTKPEWRFDAIEVRSLGSDLGFRELDATKQAWRSTGNQMLLNEVRCTKFTSTKFRGFRSNANLRWYNPEDLEYKRKKSIFPHLTNEPSMSAVTSAMDWLGQPPGPKISACHVWCGLLFRIRSGYGTLRNTDCSVVNCTRNTNTKL